MNTPHFSFLFSKVATSFSLAAALVFLPQLARAAKTCNFSDIDCLSASAKSRADILQDKEKLISELNEVRTPDSVRRGSVRPSNNLNVNDIADNGSNRNESGNVSGKSYVIGYQRKGEPPVVVNAYAQERLRNSLRDSDYNNKEWQAFARKVTKEFADQLVTTMKELQKVYPQLRYDASFSKHETSYKIITNIPIKGYGKRGELLTITADRASGIIAYAGQQSSYVGRPYNERGYITDALPFIAAYAEQAWPKRATLHNLHFVNSADRQGTDHLPPAACRQAIQKGQDHAVRARKTQILERKINQINAEQIVKKITSLTPFLDEIKKQYPDFKYQIALDPKSFMTYVIKTNIKTIGETLEINGGVERTVPVQQKLAFEVTHSNLGRNIIEDTILIEASGVEASDERKYFRATLDKEETVGLIKKYAAKTWPSKALTPVPNGKKYEYRYH